MDYSKHIFRRLISAFVGDSPSPKRRRARQLTLTVDGLEDRVVLSHLGGVHHAVAHHVASSHAERTTASAGRP